MDKPERGRSWRYWLGYAALGCLLVLLVIPASRWLLAAQLRMLFSRPTAIAAVLRDLGIREMPFLLETGVTHLSDAPMRKAAEQLPDDLPVQIAATRLQSDESSSNRYAYLSQLRALRGRFPDKPALYANILRYCTIGQIHVRRKEEEYWTSYQAMRSRPDQYQPPALEDFAAFDADAAAGERLDPDNAYFSFLRAVGLFSVSRDTEALAALHRAAGKKRWDDYIAVEQAGRDRLYATAYHDTTALSRSLRMFSVLYPEYAQLRTAGRLAVYKAIQAEQVGAWEKGLAIRHDVMCVAAVVRAESHSGIGALVGTSIQSNAISRPAGQPWQNDPKLTEAQNRKNRQDIWAAYLTGRGRGEELAWSQGQLQAGEQVKNIVQQGTQSQANIGGPLFEVGVWWMLNLIILAAILWLLAMGGLSAILARDKVGAVGIGPKIGIIFIALGLLTLLSFQIARQGTALMAIMAIHEIMENLMGTQQTGSAYTFMALIMRLAGYVGLPVLVALVVVGITVISLVRRIPLSKSMARGLTMTGLLLVFVYIGMLPKTLRAESRLNSVIDQTLRHEGRYMAAAQGTAWPGAGLP